MKKILFIIILFISFGIQAQVASKKSNKTDNAPDKNELAAYLYQSERLVEYLTETLNFLGDSSTIAKERQIVTNDSYLKIFLDSEVQIEDDLVEDRIVPVYKDVRAYLRDIGFFFKHVEFEYVIQEVQQFFNSRQEINFRVTVNRHLHGTTIKDEIVDNNMIRYIEIDLDHAKEVLKIISIYSTRLEEKEDIEMWWASLPDYWKDYFAKEIPLDSGLLLNDIASFRDSSISFAYHADIDTFVMQDHVILLDELDVPIKESKEEYLTTMKMQPKEAQYVRIRYNGFLLHSIVGNMMKQVSVDIHNESKYTDLSPLSKMTYLNELNLSGTPISDLSELRNLNDLEVLNISNTNVSDLSPLQYLINLKKIYLNDTRVSDISTLAYNSSLNEIEMNNTAVSDIFPLARLIDLKRLRMNHTQVSDISALANNNKLEIISFHNTTVSDCDILKNYPNLEMAGMNNTAVSDISELSGLKKLKNIFIENTPVATISDVTDMENLDRIYCDGSKISKEEALNYMIANPHTLVVFESDHLHEWWLNLSSQWKTIWFEIGKFKEEPNKDQLHQLVILKKLDLSYRKINNINCLSEMLSLEDLNLMSNEIDDISPLSNITTLTKLNISKTKANNINSLANNSNLETIISNGTPIVEIESLKLLNKLTLIECDNSAINDKKADALRETNPACLVIYRTSKNQLWWDNLSKEWKNVFFTPNDTMDSPDKYLLQNIINQEVIDVNENRSIQSLNALIPFRFLKKLIISNTGIQTLEDIKTKTKITYLDISNNPIELIDNLEFLVEMDTLIMENTQIKKIDIVQKFNKLRYLNFAGTQIKSLKPLATMTQLESIDFNNTAISNITPLLNMVNLKQMKAFRTKVASNKIEEFKTLHPDCEVIFY